MNDYYPAGPEGAPVYLTQPSSIYKKHAWLAVFSLLVFILLYLSLAGWFMWTTYRMFIEIEGGGPDTIFHYFVGGASAFLSIFMLKALFFLKRNGVINGVEVTASEQPKLFEFLYRLADEAGAPRPKRVYLSSHVNAGVFYDLSILNLVFPSKKNLEIGLALVNVLTLSEMKAVLAHEFGHFAQRSMAIGSWVYVAQQIAVQIIAKRDYLDRILQTISNLDIRIAWIGWLMSLIVWSIRSLMDTLLRIVVIAQRALSRQMEFQADMVAVSLTGSDELVHALHKLHIADDVWRRTLNFAGSQVQKERIPHDLFAVQLKIIERTAEILDDKFYGQVPSKEGDPQIRRIFKSSFAQPPQMWSTHPASSDRENNAKRLYLSAPHDSRSAWILFDNVELVKEKVSASLFADTKAQLMSEEETYQALDERYSKLQYDSRYRGAYLGRSLTVHASTPKDLYSDTSSDTDIKLALKELYPIQLTQDLTKLRDLVEERATLEALRDKVFKATDGKIIYRGKEISRRELSKAIDEVIAEENQAKEVLIAHDKKCRTTYLAAARYSRPIVI